MNDHDPVSNLADIKASHDYSFTLVPQDAEIKDKEGKPYALRRYQVETSFGDIMDKLSANPSDADVLQKFLAVREAVTNVAVPSFPHWTDKGEYFKNTALMRANTLSVIMDADKIIGFNLYTQGEIAMEGTKLSYMYANYAGVDETYRNRGLMQTSRTEDIKTVSPDVVSGCSAVGEIHAGILQMSRNLQRDMYPQKVGVPPHIGRIGQEIYASVNGAAARDSVDTNTLVRHGKSSYAQGKRDFPLQRALNMTPNDGLIYVSIKPQTNQQLASK